MYVVLVSLYRISPRLEGFSSLELRKYERKITLVSSLLFIPSLHKAALLVLSVFLATPFPGFSLSGLWQWREQVWASRTCPQSFSNLPKVTGSFLQAASGKRMSRAFLFHFVEVLNAS